MICSATVVDQADTLTCENTPCYSIPLINTGRTINNYVDSYTTPTADFYCGFLLACNPAASFQGFVSVDALNNSNVLLAYLGPSDMLLLYMYCIFAILWLTFIMAWGALVLLNPRVVTNFIKNLINIYLENKLHISITPFASNYNHHNKLHWTR